MSQSEKIVVLQERNGVGERGSEDSEYEDFESVVNPKFERENKIENEV